MLGRGLLTNPFLAEEIRGGAWNAPERTERLHAYIIDLYEDRLRHAGGSPKVLGRMKELWSYLMYSFEEPQNVWRKIKKINALSEYEDAVEYVFTNSRIILTGI
jgi:tRNA-dihydrouridine synthase